MKSRKVKAAAKHKTFMSKKKLRGNIPLDNLSDSDADVDHDSLMYDERRKGYEESSSDEDIQQQEDSSEEEEVLPITDDEDDDEDQQWEGDDANEDENEDSVDEEEGLPNREGWGKKKSAYYHADFVDQDRGKTYREEDAEKARAEEEEALFMQRNFRSFIGDSVAEVPELETAELPKEELIEENIKSLDKDGKLKYLKKKCPELLVLINEFKERLSELINRICPLLELVKNGTIQSESGAEYIKYKYQVLLHYCTNINFYMYLKSMGSDTSNHPVLERIGTFKGFLDRLNKMGEKAEKDMNIILEKLQNNETISFSSVNKNMLQQNERKKTKDKNRGTAYEQDEEDEQMDVGNDETEEKRLITYQIAKNKGLTAKRKKEYRNPRVHNRMKFKKAKIRRKGQVRGVIKEVKKYDGEPTGISTHVVRSIKIK